MPTYKKGDKGKYQLVVGKKAWERLKQKLKAITRKTTPKAFDERVAQLKEAQQGWGCRLPLRLWLLVLLFCLLLSRCRSNLPRRAGPPVPAPVTQPETSPKATEPPQILFLILKVEADAAGDLRRVRLLEKKQVPGVVKRNTLTTVEPSAGQAYLRLVVVGEGGQEQQVFYLEHPLRKNVEYLDEKQQFNRKEVLLREADLPVRIQYRPELHHLLIYEKLPESPQEKIREVSLF